MKESSAKGIKLAAEVIVGLAAITAVVLSVMSIRASDRANQIAERAILPQIKIVGQRLSAQAINDTLRIYTFRNTITLFNGGEATSLVQVSGYILTPEWPSLEVSTTGRTHYYRDVIPNVDILLNVWSKPPDMVEYLTAKSVQQAMSVNGDRLPIQVPSHTTTEVVVDVTVVYKNQDSAFKNIEGTLIILLTLDFPNTNSVYLSPLQMGN